MVHITSNFENGLSNNGARLRCVYQLYCRAFDSEIIVIYRGYQVSGVICGE